jgi:arabinose-5-phosphate isomerase
MHKGDRVPLVNLGTGMPEAAMTLSQMRFGCVGVIDENGCLCGIVTDGDIARNLGTSLADMLVDEVMTRNPKTVKETTLATSAMAVLNRHNISALIVIDDARRPVGIVHFHDLLRIGVA